MSHHPLIRRISHDLQKQVRDTLGAQETDILKQITEELQESRETGEPVTMEFTITLQIQHTP
jgi:signal transduction histidine kinase